MKAFLVVGPEGSGTYLLWEALASAGCGIDIEKKPENYTVRYSMPHAGKWIEVGFMMLGLIQRGYEVWPLIILRDWYCTIRSVIHRDETREWNEVANNMRTAIEKIGLLFQHKNAVYITYESFCLHPEFRRWLFCDKLGLSEPDIEIKYANEKYYE